MDKIPLNHNIGTKIANFKGGEHGGGQKMADFEVETWNPNRPRFLDLYRKGIGNFKIDQPKIFFRYLNEGGKTAGIFGVLAGKIKVKKIKN
jgi:hypothetical protein